MLTLGRDQRVRKRPEYRLIQSQGRRVPTRHFVFVLHSTTEDRLCARLGVTASRRVGNAVRRNRIKRLVREAFRTHPELFPNDVDVVVIARRDDVHLTLHTVVREWLDAEPRIRRAIQAARRDATPRDSS